MLIESDEEEDDRERIKNDLFSGVISLSLFETFPSLRYNFGFCALDFK